MELVDIGVNLGHRSFQADRDAVVARARAAGVTTLIITGTSLANSRQAVALAGAARGLYATCGVHPHEAARESEQAIADLASLSAAPEVVAIGECGLDYNRDFSPRPVQKRWFAAQIALALSRQLPLFLHERDAHTEFVQLLDHHATAGQLAVPAVVHCFTGDEAALMAYLARGFYIGITGWICDERRGLGLQQLVKRIPLDRLLLETDAPFLTPRDLPASVAAAPAPREAHDARSSQRPSPAARSRRAPPSRNEPAFLPHVARTIARCLDLPVAEVAAATTRNARAFFRLAPAASVAQ